MVNDTDEDETGIVTRDCDHCEWTATADSYSSLVTAYQDHLREDHPDVWLDT